jgi:hypothetical protein
MQIPAAAATIIIYKKTKLYDVQTEQTKHHIITTTPCRDTGMPWTITPKPNLKIQAKTKFPTMCDTGHVSQKHKRKGAVSR